MRVEITVPDAETLPPKLTVLFSSEFGGLFTDGGIDCRREGGAHWECNIPPGEWSLRFEAKGHSSALRLQAIVPAGETIDLGRITLVRGAAILGRLELPADLDPEEVELSLVPEASVFLATAHLQPPRRALLEEAGIFRFRDLPAGLYRVTARASGWATAQEGRVEVFEDRETLLPRTLEMRRPAQLELCLEPPVPPGVRRSTDTWVPTLEGLNPDAPSLPEACSTEDGCWQWIDLQPGRYEVVIADGRHSRWLRHPVELPVGFTRVALELPMIEVEGTIARGGRPVRARLVFEHKSLVSEADSRSIVLYSDTEGRFEGALPGQGRWLVKAAFSASGPELPITTVEVNKQKGDAVVHLELDAPL